MQLAELVLLSSLVAGAADGNRIPLSESSQIQFATVEEGKAALEKRDAFVNSLSRFDKQARLNTSKQVSTEQFLEFAASNVLAWSDDDTRKLASVIEKIRPKLRGLALPFPKTIQLVHTTGKEEGGAAYCRGNAIVLPIKVMSRSPKQLEHLLTHELFHVLSSHNPTLRQKLYAIVGFQPCGEVAVPESFVNRKITNPDAPKIDHAITLLVNGEKQQAVPILYASVENYDPTSGKSFFSFLEFRLMLVAENGNQTLPLTRDNDPVLVDARKLPAYFEQIGRNTGYIIHPEEILADNFMHLVHEKENLRTPRIVEEMRKALAK
jgi:hypothetical protein